MTEKERSMTKDEKIAHLENLIEVNEARFAKTKNAKTKNMIKAALRRHKKELREMGVEKYKSFGSNVTIDEERRDRESLYESGIVKPVSKTTSEFTIKKTTVEPVDLSLKQNLKTADKLVNVVTYESGIDNKDQNSSVLVQSKPARTTIASIKKTSSPVAFIKSNRNQFLSINQTELPPEVARMIT